METPAIGTNQMRPLDINHYYQKVFLLAKKCFKDSTCKFGQPVFANIQMLSDTIHMDIGQHALYIHDDVNEDHDTAKNSGPTLYCSCSIGLGGRLLR